MAKKGLAVFLILFLSGLIIAITSAVLLFLGILSSGTSGVIGIIGIGLIATSGSYKAATSTERSMKK